MEQDANRNSRQPDQDEEEETLSFCDLPIYGNGDDFSKDHDQCTSFSSSDDYQADVFEFFSEEWSTGSSAGKGIIFCGKLITYREPMNPIFSEDDRKQAKLESRDEQKPRNRRKLFRWGLFRSKSSKNPKKLKGGKLRFASNSKPLSLPPASEKCGFSVRRVSVLTSTPSRSRWHLMMFGLARFPAAEMELRDIRSRQRRRNSAGGMFTPKRGDEKVRRVRGLWSLIRGLGCGGGRAAAVVKAAAVPSFRSN